MNKLFVGLISLIIAVTVAHAQSTKSQLNTEINTNFPNNVAGQITPQILRTTTQDMVSSWVDWTLCSGGGRNGVVFWSQSSLAYICAQSSGNASTVATVNGILSNGHCIAADVTGNLIDEGGACVSSGSGVTAGATNQVAYYTTTGSVVSGANASTFSGLPIYLPPGTGGTAVSFGTRLQRELWANDYGAVCNDSTDDHTAFQNTMNEASSLGSVMRFVGTCKIGTGLTSSGAILNIQGVGVDSSIDAAANITAIGITNGVGPILKDFEITFGSAVPCGATPNTVSIGISINGLAFRGLIDNVFISCAYDGIILQGSGGNEIISNNYFSDVASNGIVVTGTQNDDSIVNNTLIPAVGANAAIFCDTCDGIRIIGNKINGGGSDLWAQGIEADFAASFVQGGDILISGNSIEGLGASADAIKICRQATTTPPLASSIQVIGNESAGGTHGFEICTDAGSAWIQDVVVNGNVFNTGGDGIVVNMAAMVTILGNTVSFDDATAHHPIVIGSKTSFGAAGAGACAIYTFPPSVPAPTACLASTNSGTTITTISPF